MPLIPKPKPKVVPVPVKKFVPPIPRKKQIGCIACGDTGVSSNGGTCNCRIYKPLKKK